MIIDKSKFSKKDIEVLSNLEIRKVKDDIDFSNILVKKPWGSEYLLFENDDVAIWILNIETNQKTSMHCHPNKNTSLICLDGEIICKTLENDYKIDCMNGIYLGKKVFHQSINSRKNRAIIMEIETPVDKFDLVRFDDNYGRVGKSYENEENYKKEENLTIKDVKNSSFFKDIGDITIEIGFAKNKSELSTMYNKSDEKVILTLLNRHIWNSTGNKEFEVGQLIVLNDKTLEEYSINDDFIYLKISKE